ncbi:MAG: hypothetical protein IJB98_03865 [Clostridia bacterium]|nr:hypothetical protein [Clostridia bacterium]
MDYNEYEKNKDITYRINSMDDIIDTLSIDVKKGTGPVYIVIESQPEVYDKATMSDITKLTQKFINLGYTPRVSFNIQDLELELEELEEIVDFGADLQKKGGDIAFNASFGEEYTFDEVIDAKCEAQKFIDIVRATNASPFEMFIMVQNYVTSRVYKDDDDNPENPRNIIKVLNGQEIVCVGYAAVMEHFLSRLGIKCLSQPCFVCSRSGESLGSHVNNVVYLEDAKYGIKGWYYLDACWDSINVGEEPFMKYAYSLIPVGDVSHMRTRDIKMNGGFFGALYSNAEQKELYNEIIESATIASATAFDIGIEREYDDLYEFLDGDDKEIVERRNRACLKMLEILREERIPKNFFEADDVPFESSVPMILANLMLESVDEDLLGTSIKGLRRYKELKKEGTLDELEYLKAKKFNGDIYDFLEKFKNGDLDVERDANLFEIEERLQCIRFAKYVDKVVTEAKKTKAISLNSYRRGIENANKAQGASADFAKIQAKRAIDKTVRLSEVIYDESSQNCFRQEALRRREENIK